MLLRIGHCSAYLVRSLEMPLCVLSYLRVKLVVILLGVDLCILVGQTAADTSSNVTVTPLMHVPGASAMVVLPLTQLRFLSLSSNATVFMLSAGGTCGREERRDWAKKEGEHQPRRLYMKRG